MSGATQPPPRSDRAATSPFLERQSYRRRRLMDAARLLPLLGILLFVVPLLWPVPRPGQGEAAATVTMSGAMIYVFCAWVLLIVTVACFGWGVQHWAVEDGPSGTGRD